MKMNEYARELIAEADALGYDVEELDMHGRVRLLPRIRDTMRACLKQVNESEGAK